jgi:hypothetical protein
MKLISPLLLLGATVVAGSNNATATPMQVRLAYAGPTGMMISWNTYSQLSQPTVRYGKDKRLLESATSDVSVTYATSTTWNNHVQLQGLEADTVYYYVPQDGDASSPMTFTTPRVAGDLTPYSVAVTVDMGLMGKDGLSTTVGKGAASPLTPNELNTQQSLEQHLDEIDFLWHRTC